MVRLVHLVTLTGFAITILAQRATLHYMPLGDSITTLGCWRAFLWDKLQKGGYKQVHFVGTQTSTTACNGLNYDKNHEGHIGYLASDIASKKQLVGWLKSAPADIVTVFLGTNDIWHKSQKTTDTLTAFSTLVDQMRDSNPKMRIIISQITPLLAANAGGGDPAVQDLNKAIPGWAKEKSTAASPIFVVDQYSNITKSDLMDGIHPNDAGAEKVASKFYPALLEAIESLS